MTENAVSILNNCITAGMSLIVAFGTWHITMKKDREKQVGEVKKILDNHREEYLSGIQDVKDEVSDSKATVQTYIAVTNEKIDTLSKRVEKHNNIIDRTYKLETEMAVAKEEISVVKANVDTIRRGDNA